MVNPFQNKPWFLRVCSTSLLKTLWEKEKLLVTSNFSFSPQRFLPTLGAFCHFHQIWNCRLQALSVWKRLKFVVWERVKTALKNGWRIRITIPRQEYVTVIWSERPRPGGSVMSVSDSWPGGCEFETRLRQTFFWAYFRLSTLLQTRGKQSVALERKLC